jgi:phage/plasmid-like protein (TIGR03299 family)
MRHLLGDKYANEAVIRELGMDGLVGTGSTALQALSDAKALWTVEKAPAFYHHDRDGFLPQNNTFWITRDDTGRPVTGATVSSRYQTFQNFALGEWADLLVDTGEASKVSAMVLDGGGRVMLFIQLAPSQTLERLEQGLKPCLIVGTSHDGSGSLFASTMAFREVCVNTLHHSIPQMTRSIRIRHTKSMAIEVSEVQRALNLAETWSEAFDKEVAALLDAEVSPAKARQVVETIWPTDPDEDSPRTVTMRLNKQEGVLDVLLNSPALEGIRHTGWGFVNAVTEWDQWEASGRNNGVDRHMRTLAWNGADWLATRARNLVLSN